MVVIFHASIQPFDLCFLFYHRPLCLLLQLLSDSRLAPTGPHKLALIEAGLVTQRHPPAVLQQLPHQGVVVPKAHVELSVALGGRGKRWDDAVEGGSIVLEDACGEHRESFVSSCHLELSSSHEVIRVLILG